MEKRLVNTGNRSTSCMKEMGVPWKCKKWKRLGKAKVGSRFGSRELKAPLNTKNG